MAGGCNVAGMEWNAWKIDYRAVKIYSEVDYIVSRWGVGGGSRCYE